MPKKRIGRPVKGTGMPRPGGARSGDESITLINFVLDKSGSMAAIAEATIAGFNEFKRAQAAAPGRALFSLTLFDTEVRPVCTAVPIGEVVDLDHASYRPDSCTALYDAVGSTIEAVDAYLEQHPSAAEKVVFAIMTDGLENASRRYSQRAVFDMIADRQERCGYDFVYLGANQDSYLESQRMGVRAGRNLDFAADEASVQASMAMLSDRMVSYRQGKTPQMESWFDEEQG